MSFSRDRCSQNVEPTELSYYFLIFFQTMGDLTSLSVEEIFQLLESNNPEIVCEIQRLFHENLSETREGWLVSGLYDYYTTTGSANGLKLLLNVKVSIAEQNTESF